jgi:hypothetical protein
MNRRLAHYCNRALVALILGAAGCSAPVDSVSPSSPALKGSGSSSSTSIPTETEPNDDPSFATGVIGSQLGGSVRGWISTATDVDVFVSHAVMPGKEVSLTLSVPSDKDYDVQIISYDGAQVLASAHAGTGRTESVRLKNETSTTMDYKFRVFSYDGSFSTTSSYVLTVGKVI